MTPPRAAAYVRLSRQDIRKGESIDNHIGIVQHLARQHNIRLEVNDIIAEIEQSDRIDTRAGLLRVLELARSGAITHLVTFDVSRMTRGLEDQWADIKRALFRGAVVLVTPRGLHRFDNQLDTTVLDIEAVLARRYRWEYSVKRQAHNAQRTRSGRRSCGTAPFGYRWIPPTYEGQRAIAPGRVEVIPEEYSTVEDIYRMAPTHGPQSIADALNARGVPTSGARRRPGDTPRLWSHKTIRGILGNPWYAGYVVHRWEMQREQGQRPIPRDRWLWSDAPGDWPTPVDLAAWHEIQERIAARGHTGAVRVGLLSGILRCVNGYSMARAGGGDYRCNCRVTRGPHPGSTVSAARIDAYARAVVEHVIDAVDPETLPVAPQRPRRDVYTAIADTQRRLQDATRTLDQLITQASLFDALPDFGRDRYEANIRTLSTEGDALRQRLNQLRAEASAPDTAEAAAMLSTVRDRRAHLWDTIDGWGIHEHRAIVRTVITEIRLERPARGAFLRSVATTLTPPFAQVPPPPLCPKGKTIRTPR